MTVAPPGMTNLTPEQTDELKRLSGDRYLTIQQTPEKLNRKQRRALGQRSPRRRVRH